MSTETQAEKLLAFAAALDGERRPWDALWQELADVCHPRRGMITGGPQVGTPDRTRIVEAFDSTAQRACRTLANGQASRITPMGARWFGLKPPEHLQNNRVAIRYFQEAGETLSRKLADSNFYNRATEHYLDRGAFGTAATMVVAGDGRKGLSFKSLPVGNFSIAHDDKDQVNTLCLSFKRLPGDLKNMFPKTCPASIDKKMADPKGRLEPLEVKYIIRPRYERDPRKKDALNKPFECVYLLVGEKCILEESGFDRFPVPVSRWELWGDSPYGWAPSYHALPEATQLNFLEQMLDTLAEVAAFPRVRYPSNLKGDVDYRALGLTCYDPSNSQKPEEWLTGGRYDIGKDRAEIKRKAIEEAFFVPLFNAISNLSSDATAEQVRALLGESRELFHPIYANGIREFQQPVLRRSFAVLLEQGEIPPPPGEILDRDELGYFLSDPEVEFTSPMALALEQSQLANFSDVIQTLEPLGINNPDVWDCFDLDAIGPAFARYKGLPASFIRNEKAIAEIRSARAQAQQAQMAEQAAGAVQKLGGAPGIQDLAGMAGMNA